MFLDLVPMHNSGSLVEILNCLGDLHNNMATELFTEVGQSHDLMEQLATGAEFEDDIVVLTRLGETNQLDDIRVVKIAHDLHFFQDVGTL